MPSSNEKEFLIKVRADLKNAIDQLKRLGSNIGDTGKKAKSSKKDVDGFGKAVGRLGAAAGVYLSVRTAIKIIQVADAYQVLDQRIRTATKATGDYTSVSEELFRISNANGVALNETVSLFQNLARTAPELGASNEQMLALTNTIQQLGVISGATQSQLSAGLLQFSQGLAGGVFRAEEFNSIIENLPEVATRIAKGMGQTVGQLRRGVLEGKVLSQDVFESLLKQSEDITAEFKSIPTSLERATQSLQNSLIRLTGVLDKQTGTTSGLAGVLKILSGAIDDASDKLDPDSDESLLRRLELYNDLIENAFARGIPIIDDYHIKKNLENINQLNEKLEEFRAKAEKPITGPPAPKQVPVNQNQDSIDKLIQSLQLQAETIGKTREAVALYKLEQDGATASELAAARAHIGTIQAYDKQQAIMQEGNQIIADTRTEMENLAQTLAHLDQLYEQGAFGIVGSTAALETYARAVFDAQEKTEDFGEETKDTFTELEAAVKGWGDEFTNTLADMVVEGKGNFKDLADAIIKDLLRILIYQNLVRPVLGAFGVDVGTNHTGGLAGTGPTRTISPLAFAGAPRYHTGGLAGLKRNEVPAILQKGEEVLTTNDPRHAFNQGAGSGVRVEVINKGTPAEATQANTRFDAGDLVVSVVLDDLDRGGRITNKLDSRFGRR